MRLAARLRRMTHIDPGATIGHVHLHVADGVGLGQAADGYERHYQFTFAPMRRRRGGTMAVGRRNDDPDAHVMF